MGAEDDEVLIPKSTSEQQPLRKKPLIGIAGRVADITEDLDVTVSRGNYYCLRTYVDAISGLGGVPIILPPINNPEIAYLDVFKNGFIHGLLVPGGCDVDPKLYHGTGMCEPGHLFPEIDKLDYALLNLAQRFRIPVLGICRGMQVINVWRGGCLRDVHSGHDFHDRDRQTIVHILRVASDSRLAQFCGSGGVILSCNSLHHQACSILGNELRANCWANDNVVEGLEWSGSDWWLVAVQSHPEELWRDYATWKSLFENFLLEAADTGDFQANVSFSPKRKERLGI